MFDGPIGPRHLVHHGRRAGHERQLVLALESLLHDVHVQQAQETAAKAKPECAGHLRLVVQGRVVQTQLRERIAKLLVLLGIDREQPGKNPRLDLLEPRQRRGRGAPFERDGIADRCAVDLLDTGHHEADIPGGQFALHHRLGREAPDPIDHVAAPGGHHADLVAGTQAAVHDPHQRDHACVVVEPGIDDQRLQRSLAVAARRRDAPDQRLEQFRHALAGLGADARSADHRLDADDFLDLAGHPLGFGRGQVDLVDDRQHLQSLLDRRIAVGDALRLDPLGGIHHQQRPVAGGQ